MSCAVTLVLAGQASAHHSFAAFEETRVRTLDGTIEKFRWSNPHVMLTMLAKEEGHAPQEWTLVTSNPSILGHFGWQRTSLKAGDHVRAVCNPMRDGSPQCRLHTLTVVDSRRVLRTKLSAPGDSGVD